MQKEQILQNKIERKKTVEVGKEPVKMPTLQVERMWMDKVKFLFWLLKNINSPTFWSWKCFHSEKNS